MKRLIPFVFAAALLFAEYDQEPPKAKALPPVAHVASCNMEVLHHPRCEWALKILPENAQQFAMREEALAAGKKPRKIYRHEEDVVTLSLSVSDLLTTSEMQAFAVYAESSRVAFVR